jgi:6-phosphogluconolactonase
MQSIKRMSAGLAAMCALLSIGALAQPGAGELLVYFGTYTRENSKGVYVSRLDLSSGTLSAPQLAAETTNPSFLAVHPTRPFLYAVNEVGTFEGKPSGSVSAFAIDHASGTLTFLNRQPSAGADPAHLVVDKAGRHVLVANYTGGNVAVLPIDADGRLKPATAVVQHTGSSVDPARQKEPHAHGVTFDPANRLAYVADLGLDRVQIYRFDAAKGSLTGADPKFAAVRPGSGPRHVTIHPGGGFTYVINEMSCTITVFRVDSKSGGLLELQTVSTLPVGQAVETGYSTAEIMVHPSGRFLYGSNRGHNTIAMFAIDAASGKLAAVQHEPTQGSTPRGFGIDPSGAYLVVGNQRSDSVVVFRIDRQTGRLAPTGQEIEVDSPVSVEFVRSP